MIWMVSWLYSHKMGLSVYLSWIIVWFSKGTNCAMGRINHRLLDIWISNTWISVCYATLWGANEKQCPRCCKTSLLVLYRIVIFKCLNEFERTLKIIFTNLLVIFWSVSLLLHKVFHIRGMFASILNSILV